MKKLYFVASLVVFILWMAGSFVTHEILLAADYESVGHLYRSDADMQSHMIWMLLAHILLAFALTWIFIRGHDNKPWLGQGLRFGIAVVFLNVAPIFLIYYSIQPIPGTLVAKQILFEGIVVILLSLLLAYIYREKNE